LADDFPAPVADKSIVTPAPAVVSKTPSQVAISKAIDQSGTALLQEMVRITSPADRLFFINEIIHRLSISQLEEYVHRHLVKGAG
jgi:hypothetical protein